MSDEPRKIPNWVFWIVITAMLLLTGIAAIVAYGQYRERQSFGPFPIEPHPS